MCFTGQFTNIYLQQAISCNEFKARCLGWPGVYFMVTSPLSLFLSEVSVSDSCPPLPAKQSLFDSVPSRNEYFGKSTGNLSGSNACDDGIGSGSGGVCLLHIGFCLFGVLRLVGFMSSSGNCCPLNRKSSQPVFLVHPEVQGSICVSQWPVQCLYS